MAKKSTLEYSPDYAVPPGETLIETLDALGMSIQQLSKSSGLSIKVIDGICAGKSAISESVAAKLSLVLKIPADFWMSLEKNYREAQLRLAKKTVKRSRLSVPKPVAKAV